MVSMASALEFGTVDYVESAFTLYQVEANESESEEDPESEAEVEELSPVEGNDE